MPAVQLNLAFTPSRRHGLFLIVGHAVLLLVLLVLPVSLLHMTVLLSLLLVNGYYTHRSWRKQGEITHLAVDSEQLAVVCHGQWRPVQTLSPVLVASWLTILKLKVDGNMYVLSLWRDSADAEPLRQLRVWLLCGYWKRRERAS